MKTTLPSLLIASVATLLVACGNPIDGFVGLYDETATHTITLNTPNGQATDTSQQTRSVTVLEGARSDLIVRAGDCSILFDVDDFESASAVPGSTCTVKSADGRTTTTYTFTTGSILHASKFSNVSFNATISVLYDGATYTGTYSMTGTWIKASK